MGELHIIGVTDEQTTCDLCGKVNLARTVIVGQDGTETGRYGTSCVSRILGRKVTARVADNIEAVRRQNFRTALARIRRTCQNPPEIEPMLAITWEVREARKLCRDDRDRDTINNLLREVHPQPNGSR